MMRKILRSQIFSLSFLLVWTFQALPAQNILTPGEPFEVGMSREKLQTAVNVVSEMVKRQKIQGVVLLVARNSRIVLHKALGWRNKEKLLPMKTSTLLRIASNTKPILAAAVQILSEDGYLLLDNEIGRYLPSFKNYRYRGMTIRHLLNHTSGLRIPGLFLEPLMKKSPKYPDAPSLQLEVSRFSKLSPETQPGEKYSYSNAGYNILGALVEVCSGQALEQFLREKIYQPLGMKQTFHHPNSEMIGRMSVVYEPDDKGWKIRFHQKSPSIFPFTRGSGGVICSALDYAKFCQMFLNRGNYNGNRILSKKSVTEATSQQVRINRSFNLIEEYNAQEAYRGFTWNVSNQGIYSCGGGHGTFAWVDPNRQLIGLIFTQSGYQAISGRKGLSIQFMQLVNSAIKK